MQSRVAPILLRQAHTQLYRLEGFTRAGRFVRPRRPEPLRTMAEWDGRFWCPMCLAARLPAEDGPCPQCGNYEAPPQMSPDDLSMVAYDGSMLDRVVAEQVRLGFRPPPAVPPREALDVLGRVVAVQQARLQAMEEARLAAMERRV